MAPSSALGVRDIWGQGRKLNPVDSAFYSVSFPCKSMTQSQRKDENLRLAFPLFPTPRCIPSLLGSCRIILSWSLSLGLCASLML